jgi:hypothetical protein
MGKRARLCGCVTGFQTLLLGWSPSAMNDSDLGWGWMPFLWKSKELCSHHFLVESSVNDLGTEGGGREGGWV